jgi:hypothetical protein
MRRPFVTVLMTSSVVALALLPAAVFAQNAPAQQPAPQGGAGQPGAAQAAPQAEKKEPRMSFSGDAGVFLYQIKPDQTAVFEELVTKVKDVLAKSDKPERKQQLTSWKLYKANEPSGANTLYVFLADPAVKGAEYDLLMLLAEGLGAAAGTPENQELFKKYVAAFAAGANRLNLTPVASGGAPGM